MTPEERILRALARFGEIRTFTQDSGSKTRNLGLIQGVFCLGTPSQGASFAPRVAGLNAALRAKGSGREWRGPASRALVRGNPSGLT